MLSVTSLGVSMSGRGLCAEGKLAMCRVAIENSCCRGAWEAISRATGGEEAMLWPCRLRHAGTSILSGRRAFADISEQFPDAIRKKQLVRTRTGFHRNKTRSKLSDGEHTLGNTNLTSVGETSCQHRGVAGYNATKHRQQILGTR